MGIIRNDHVDPDECDNIAKDLFFSKILRPQWDAEALLNIGFRRLWIDTNISDRIWDEEDKILNRSTPMFLICGKIRIRTIKYQLKRSIMGKSTVILKRLGKVFNREEPQMSVILACLLILALISIILAVGLGPVR